MSVCDVDIVDFVYLEDTGTPVLVVTDSIDWRSDDDEDHLEMLREKLNSQIAFVETGQLETLYPPYDGGIVRVEVVARHALTEEAEEFYGMAAEIMSRSNMDLQFRLCHA